MLFLMSSVFVPDVSGAVAVIVGKIILIACIGLALIALVDRYWPGKKK